MFKFLVYKGKLVHIRTDYKETYIRKIVKEAGERWDKEKKFWEMHYKEVIKLGLKNRIMNIRIENVYYEEYF